MDLKYYNPDIHRASFILPEFAKKVLLIFNMHRLEHNYTTVQYVPLFTHVSFLSFLILIGTQ